MPRRIVFTAKDGIQTIGDYVEAAGNKAAILLHMMPADRHSWTEFAARLAEKGYATIAIDERGHGDSTMNGTLSYKQFTDAQQQEKILDVDAVIEFLVGEGYAKENMIVVGASIGANLSIQTLARYPEIPFAIALSPGIDYHGARADSFLREFSGAQKVVIVASDDDQYSFESVKKLQQQDSVHTILITRLGIGHGTNMTDADQGLVQELLSILP